MLQKEIDHQKAASKLGLPPSVDSRDPTDLDAARQRRSKRFGTDKGPSIEIEKVRIVMPKSNSRSCRDGW